MSQNIKWALDSEGTLTFTGKGDMPDYDFLDGYGFVNNMSPFANDPYIWDRDTYDGIVKNVVISEGITRVGNGFFCLKSLKTVRLPDSLKSIGNGAFYACNNLESIRMPASVTSIGTLAFAYCTSLETVNIPKSITSMGTRVFEGTRWLGSKAMDNELVIENRILLYGKPEGDFVVPDEVTYITGSGIGERSPTTHQSSPR